MKILKKGSDSRFRPRPVGKAAAARS